MDSRGDNDTSNLSPPKNVARSATARQVDPNQLWSAFQCAEPPIAYWSSPRGLHVLSTGEASSITTPFSAGFDRIAQEANAISKNILFDGPAPARPRFIGATRFDGRTISDSRWDSFPEQWFLLPKKQYITTSDGSWVTIIGSEGKRNPPDPAPVLVESDESRLPVIEQYTSEPGEQTWKEQVEAVLRRIRDGSVTKIVLANRRNITLSESIAPALLAKLLEQNNPGCFITILQPTADAYFAAATPERLVQRSAECVKTTALAGSIPRGSDPRRDVQLSDELKQSNKNTHEHDVVVDAIQNRLESMGATVTLGDRSVRQLRSVQHLQTPIRAEYDTTPHVLELIDKIHPTPAVGGSPRKAAVDALQDIESFDRRWYAAPVGWFDAAGNGSFAIGIRSAIFRHESVTAFAGAGIVSESNPAEEWDELQWKYQPICDLFTQSDQ